MLLEQSKKKNIKNGIVMGIVNNAVNIILPFLSKTVILYTLGIEFAGLGGLFTSIINVLSLTEMGFGAAISYMLYKPIAESDTAKVNALLRLYRKIYRAIGILIVLISIGMIPFIRNLIAGDIPDSVDIYILFGIYVFNTASSYLFFGYRRVLISANERYDVEVSIASVVALIRSTIQISLLLIYKDYYLYIMMMPIATIADSMICYIYTKRKFPQYKCDGHVEKNDLSLIMKNVLGAFLAKVGSTIYLSVDNIVISAFLGLFMLGVYTNYYYILAALIALFAVIHNSIRPVIGNNIVRKSVDENWRLFKNINNLYMILTVFCCNCCLALFQDFEKIWGGTDNVLPFFMVLLFVFYFYSGKQNCILTVYQEASGLLWHGKYITILAAIVNLTVNIVLVQIIGLPGILISSITANILITLPGTMYVMFKYYFNDNKYIREYMKSILYGFIKLILTSLIVFLTTNRFIADNIYLFALKLIFTVLISVILLIIFNFRSEEMRNFIREKSWKK
ncbi:MAG: hypothetical protein K5894_13965 [Lachnospiraceae bacterium]|nr:hypothetical protein [Lachnospiraceae bacterium]